MSIQIVTYRDDFFSSEADVALWTQLIRAFGVDRVDYLDDGVFSVPTDGSLVVFDEDGSVPLSSFEHPESATYLFGCTGMRNLPTQFPNATSVNIDITRRTPNQGLFGVQAATIVLYDREMKRGS